jgi:Delta3-Delta2-enoyl-CoA isomerase
MPDLKRDGDVFVLHLGDDENRFNPTWLEAVGEALDEVEAAEAPRALVTTATGKFWSNGLDLAWVGEDLSRLEPLVASAHALYIRFLQLPLPTVAAIQGHAFAAGAMLALAHDLRVMREDRGFWCLPEVDLGMAFTPGMSALVASRLTPQVAHEAMVTGRRYGGPEAAALGLVDAAVAEDEVRPDALERARALAGKPGASVAAIRAGMYGPVLEALRRDDPLTLPG